MKILVTGGAGFIASHIVDAYVEQGHHVVVVDNLSTGKETFLNRKAKFYKCDIRDKSAIDKIVTKEKPEVINHHAAQISVRESVANPVFDADVNILGLITILEAGQRNQLKKFIFASSGGVVYGEASRIPTTEIDYPYQPLSPYGVSKLTSEHYLHVYFKTYGISSISLRYGNVYGPRQNPHGEAGVVAIFSLKALKKKSPTINGDGLQTRDYIYVKDVSRANLLALESSKVGAFNIGTGKETNVLEIFSGIRKESKSGVKAIHGPAKSGEQKRSCLDCTKARKELGWTANTDLSDGLKYTFKYFQTNNHE